MFDPERFAEGLQGIGFVDMSGVAADALVGYTAAQVDLWQNCHTFTLAELRANQAAIAATHEMLLACGVTQSQINRVNMFVIAAANAGDSVQAA